MKPKFPFFSLYPSLNETKSLRGRAPATLSENHHLTQHGKVNTKIQPVWVIGYGGVNPQDKMTNRNVEERQRSQHSLPRLYQTFPYSYICSHGGTWQHWPQVAFNLPFIFLSSFDAYCKYSIHWSLPRSQVRMDGALRYISIYPSFGSMYSMYSFALQSCIYMSLSYTIYYITGTE